MKQFNMLYKVCLLFVLSGCMETVTENVYCVTVLEEDTCPTLEAVNESDFPVDVCGGTHRQALAFDERNDNTSVWYDETEEDAARDACCFQTEYVQSGNSNCVEE